MHLQHLLTITIELDRPALLGPFPLGERRLITFRSGTFDGGGELRGTVAPGGIDWQTVRTDGVIDLKAHYLLRTDQDEPIEVTSEGLRVAAPDVAARLAAGDIVDPAEYYFRTLVRLSTSAPRWDRLNQIVAVSTGERRAAGVAIHVHEVL